MELNQLQCFVVVARTENITKAAQELYITQPALSRVILRLERELEMPLFDRNGGRITLNENGRLFLSYVQPALDSIQNGIHALAEAAESREIILHNYLTTDLLRSIVERCQAEFPRMTFTVKNIGDNADDETMQSAEPDIVLLPTRDFRNYIFPMTWMERWCVIYNSRYAFHTPFDGHSMTLAQLAAEPVAFFGSHYDREFLEGLFGQAGLSPHLEVCTDLAESSTRISRCRAVGFVPMTNFRSLIRSIDSIPIAAAVVSDIPCQRLLYLGHSPRFLSGPDEERVLDFIRDHLSEAFADTDAFYDSYFGIS